MSDGSGQQRLQYSTYLLRDHITDPELALRAKYRLLGTQCRREHPAISDNAGIRAFSLPSEEKIPPWADALKGEFAGLDSLRGRTNSFIVIASVEKRLVAFTFGYGHNMLDPDAYEPSFGLRVGARLMGADQIQTVEGRSLDASALTRRVTVATVQHVDSFGFDFDGDWVRRLIGRVAPAEGKKLGDLVSAADSYKFKSTTTISTAVQEVTRFLRLLTETKGAEEFDFIDNLTPLKPGTSILDKLNAQLVEEMFESQTAKTTLAPVENLNFDEVAYYSVSVNKREYRLEQLDLSELIDVLKELRVRSPRPSLLDRVKIVAVGHDDNEVSQLLPLRNWVVHEVSPRGDETYILTLGRWFKLSDSYRQRVERKVREIPDVSPELRNMPSWPRSEHEIVYNKRASHDLHGLCMDTITGKSSLGRARAEFCDILMPDRSFIHVKRANSSQSLSYLFVQGSTSASLLSYDVTYQRDFREELARLDSSHPALSHTVPERVVYAIGTRKKSDVYSSLFTVAKVALLVHKRENDRITKTALCKIELT